MQPICISLSLTRVYLLPCAGGYLQIDAGYEHDYPAYRKGLAQAGIPLEQVRYLALTHHHDDHAGFLNQLTRDADLTLIAHRLAGDLLRGGANDRSRGGGYVNRRVRFLAGLKARFDPRWSLSFPPFALRERDIRLDGDDRRLLRDLDVAGTLLYTPGHCIDHLAVVLDSGEAFCGDAAANFLTWAGTRHCCVFMTDMDQAYRSWQKLLDAGAQRIYPAHGRPFAAGQLRRDLGRIQNGNLARFF